MRSLKNGALKKIEMELNVCAGAMFKKARLQWHRGMSCYTMYTSYLITVGRLGSVKNYLLSASASARIVRRGVNRSDTVVEAEEDEEDEDEGRFIGMDVLGDGK